MSVRNFLVPLAAAGLLAAQAAGVQAAELKFGHVGEPGSLFDQSATEFARRANERLQEAGADYEVAVYGSSQLGADKEMLKKLKLGTIDFVLPSTVMSSEVQEFGLFEMPYLVRDREHMKAIGEQVFWPHLAPAAEERGYKIIGLWENGFRHITNNVRPINTPEDLQGIKLRTPKGVWRVKMFQQYGANPSPTAFSEVFVALQTGVMDGQENPLAQIYPAKFYEVQEYLSLTGHVYTPAYVTVNPDKFASLPEEVQAILSEEARAMQDFVYETAAAMEEDLLQKLIDEGMQVNEADKQAFIDASGPIYDAFAQEVEGGGELIELAQNAGAAAVSEAPAQTQ